jgi:rubrerythrin
MKHVKRSPAFPLIPNKAEYCLVGNKKKRKYPTQLDAELSSPAKELQQYVCEYCGYWHNGKSSIQLKV